MLSDQFRLEDTRNQREALRLHAIGPAGETVRGNRPHWESFAPSIKVREMISGRSVSRSREPAASDGPTANDGLGHLDIFQSPLKSVPRGKEIRVISMVQFDTSV
jgi:hypothetical protein